MKKGVEPMANNVTIGQVGIGGVMFRVVTLAAILSWVFAGNPFTAQVTPATILEIDVENITSYSSDVFDASKFATDPNLTTPAPARNFGFVMAVGDIVAVNGKPAKGSLIARQQAVILSPAPNPGQGIADVVRTAITEFLFEMQQAEGTPVGSIHTSTASGGAAPVGLSGGAAPLGVPLGSNHVVVGGSGAFVGARGQGASAVLPGNTGPRVASITEDPARRRNHGGGRVHFVYQLIPMTRPEVATLASGPAIYHADFTPVTAGRPAAPGEVLIVRATGLGPTRPGLNPGQPFASDVLQEVNSPVEVLVGGRAAEVVNKIGWPGTIDTYRVDFRVPTGTPAGMASIQISAAWVAARDVHIPVQ
jgi:uncharacterized protein (TIGR03437 family)